MAMPSRNAYVTQNATAKNDIIYNGKLYALFILMRANTAENNAIIENTKINELFNIIPRYSVFHIVNNGNLLYFSFAPRSTEILQSYQV